VDLRTQTSLFCGALALAIAASVLLRGKPRRAQWLFAAFAIDIGLWYLAQWVYLEGRAAVWARFTALLAILMPQFALHLFEAIFPASSRSLLLRVAGGLLALMAVLVLSPQHEHGLVRGAVVLYVFGLFAAGLLSLLRRGERSRSRATQRRVRFLVVCGALAASFSLADFLWFIGAPLPPVGAVLSIVFLFVLAESLIRARLVDLYDMAGLALVSTTLAFSLAGIFYLCVVLLGGFQTMYLNAVLGGSVTLMLFEPLRDRLDAYFHRALFLERVDLERVVARAKTELAHVLNIEESIPLVMTALEESRRATSGALYLRDALGADFELGGQFGGAPPLRIDAASLRMLLDGLVERRSIDLGALNRELAGAERNTEFATVPAPELLLASAENLGDLRRAVCVAVPGQQRELLGLILVDDDRLEDAFSADDLSLLESLGLHLATVVENSRQHLQLQERARLAALGQMAAGLAHEIRNPLGAIKGAAQLLAEPGRGDPPSSEFVSIILEEVDRLDRVVGSVLDYARPAPGAIGTIDVNAIVERTTSLLRSSSEFQTRFECELESAPLWVRADPEQIQQVLMNLLRNAAQAMDGSGVAQIVTRHRSGSSAHFIEISVVDCGPGIPDQLRRSLFVPFFTTKPTGTGLGLAITERIVLAMGGRIEVGAPSDRGATFTVVLPAAEEPVRGAAAPGVRNLHLSAAVDTDS
jgi:signal transduction histidine kinase